MTTVTRETINQLEEWLGRYQTTAAQLATLLTQQAGSLNSSARKLLCTLLLTTAAYLKLDLERTRVQLQVESPIKPLPPEEQAHHRKLIEQELAADTKTRWHLWIQREELDAAITLFRDLAIACQQKQVTLKEQQATLVGKKSAEDLGAWLESLQDLVLRLEEQAAVLRSHPQRESKSAESAPIEEVELSREKVCNVDPVSSGKQHEQALVPIRPSLNRPQCLAQTRPDPGFDRVLFVSQPEASLVVTPDPKSPIHAYQTLICRGRPTDYRGPVRIYATKHGARTEYMNFFAQSPLGAVPAFPHGVLMGVAELVDCRKPSRDFTQLAKEWHEVNSYQLSPPTSSAQIDPWFRHGMTWLWEFRNPMLQVLPPPAPLHPWRGGTKPNLSSVITHR